ETARNAFEHAIQSAAKHDEWLRENPPHVEWFEGQFESTETATDSDIVVALKKNHSQIQGRDPSIHGVTYGSDLRFFTNNAEMPAVLYGPGDVKVAHSVNEFVPIDEVVNVAKIVALTALQWCRS
ncbi:MAG TPA: M20/M25/M40 family metallo-hydrolase, partial [Acidobacteriota bacterium]|nr:M20/M25/M40 family metallo-hydrolase [Acidobacteriota bacterium]